MRNQETLRAGLVTRDDVSRSGQGQLNQVGASGQVTNRGEGVDNAERAMRDVMKPGRNASADLPLHATRGRFRGGQVWRHREDRQVKVTRADRAQRYARVPAEQLELIGPPLPVKTRADQVNGLRRRSPGGALPEQVLGRPQRERHAGQAGVQAGQLPFPGYRPADRLGAPSCRDRVAVIPEVAVPLKQGQHDPGRAAVQRRVELVVIWPGRPLQGRPAIAGHRQQPLQGTPCQRRAAHQPTLREYEAG